MNFFFVAWDDFIIFDVKTEIIFDSNNGCHLSSFGCIQVNKWNLFFDVIFKTGIVQIFFAYSDWFGLPCSMQSIWCTIYSYKFSATVNIFEKMSYDMRCLNQKRC